MNLTHQDQDFPEWLLLYVARSLGGNYDTSFVKHPRGTSRFSWARNRPIEFPPVDVVAAGCSPDSLEATAVDDVYMTMLEVWDIRGGAYYISVAYDKEDNILHWAIP